MPDRLSSARTSMSRGLGLAVDVVLLTPRGDELAALLVPPTDPARVRPRDRFVIPSDGLRGDESLEDAAGRIARAAGGAAPAFLEQALSVGGSKRQVDAPEVTVIYYGLVPAAAALDRPSGQWTSLSELANVAARQREIIDIAIVAMRDRVDQQPIAFRLLPAEFTLSELQGVYELLLGRRLHKASFRRSLHASALVEATDEWRSEGRGRPAQLFRYAPSRRRRQRRGMRFDLIG
jgi:8-oxo-dGTP diphosphatase